VTETGYLDDANILYWLGITQSATSARLTVRTTTGRQQSVLVRAANSGNIVTPDLLFSFVSGVAHVPLPLYLQDAAALYWMDVLKGPRAVYLKYNECLGTSGFQQLAAAILKQHPDYRLIADLRGNIGGDTTPFQSLVNSLAANPEINRPGRVFGIARAGSSAWSINSRTPQPEVTPSPCSKTMRSSWAYRLRTPSTNTAI